MLGNNIKELRKAKRMTQKELADTLHVSQQTVGSWETERAIPGADTLAQLADYFGVTTDYLLGRSEKKSSSEEQETKDLKKFLEDNLDNGMTFGDGKVTQEDREKLEIRSEERRVGKEC